MMYVDSPKRRGSIVFPSSLDAITEATKLPIARLKPSAMLTLVAAQDPTNNDPQQATA